jgi:catechol 2,3-dioxygenase-like lactoylglutathione lyase family enzyme
VVELLQYGAPAGERLAYRSWDPASTHLALSVDDLDAVRSRLTVAGVEIISRRALTISEPGTSWDGVRCLFVRDPDGAVLELVQQPS